MFKKIKEFFSKKTETADSVAWPFPVGRSIDAPIIIPEPINAVPIPQPPPVVEEQLAPKAPATKTVAKTTKAAAKPPAATKQTKTTTKRSPGRPSKKP